MKVFFNPAYTNFIYQNLEENPLQFDQKVCNTEALLELLEKHAGLHSQVADEIERCLEYCKCMAKYLDENPNSIFAAFYKIDAFNTAKQCLPGVMHLFFLAGLAKVALVVNVLMN